MELFDTISFQIEEIYHFFKNPKGKSALFLLQIHGVLHVNAKKYNFQNPISGFWRSRRLYYDLQVTEWLITTFLVVFILRIADA